MITVSTIAAANRVPDAVRFVGRSDGNIDVYVVGDTLPDLPPAASQPFSNDDAGAIVFDAAADDDDAPNFAAALSTALAQKLVLRVPSGRTVRLLSAVDIDCGQTWGDTSQFGLVVDGLIYAGPGVKALTIRNCWFGKFSLRFAGGGSTVDDSGFRLVGGYNNAVEIEGDLYAGTLLEIENGLSSGAGGNGRIDIKRLVTRNCGRSIYAHPSVGSTSQNGFGRIGFMWSNNDVQGATFNSTQDIYFDLINVDVGLPSGSGAGIYFNGCNSIYGKTLAVGEVKPNASRGALVQFISGGNVAIENVYVIHEAGASGTASKSLNISQMKGFSAGVAITGAFNRAIEVSGELTTSVHLRIDAKSCGKEVLYAQSNLSGLTDMTIRSHTTDCGDAGTHVINLSQIHGAGVTVRNVGANPSAASDLLLAASNGVQIEPGSVFTGDTLAWQPSQLAANSATPSVKGGKYFRTANTVATTITNLMDGYPGQEVVIEIADAFTTVDFTGTALKGNGGSDWSPNAGYFMRGLKSGRTGNWLCSTHVA